MFASAYCQLSEYRDIVWPRGRTHVRPERQGSGRSSPVPHAASGRRSPGPWPSAAFSWRSPISIWRRSRKRARGRAAPGGMHRAGLRHRRSRRPCGVAGGDDGGVRYSRLPRQQCRHFGAAPRRPARGRAESFDRLIAVNLRGTFFLTQAMARLMLSEAPRRSLPLDRHRLVGQFRCRLSRPGRILPGQVGAEHDDRPVRAAPRGGRHPRLRGAAGRHRHGP